jgi:N6-adenosine-specific RNA methylase IME4
MNDPSEKLPSLLSEDRMLELARSQRVQEIADAASDAIAQNNDDPATLREIERRLGKIKKIVGEVTGKRLDINRIAVPMVRAAVTGGRLLAKMAETGERATGHGDQKSASHRARPIQTLAELGFTWSRASRWQLAGGLPDDLIEAAQQRVLDADDEVWGLNHVLRAARAARKDDAKRKLLDAVFSDDGPFGTVVIDPPWQVENIDRDVRPNQAEFPYEPMTTDEIVAFWQTDMAPRLEPDCHLFLWTTQKWLPTAFKIVDAIDFRYVFTMVWHKTGGFQPIGLAQYNCEFIIYARHNSPLFVDTKEFDCCFEAPRREPSRKPDFFYDAVRRVTGGSRIDVSRASRAKDLPDTATKQASSRRMASEISSRPPICRWLPHATADRHGTGLLSFQRISIRVGRVVCKPPHKAPRGYR